MSKKKENKEKKELEIVDLTTVEYPHSDIIQIEEVTLPDEAIIDDEVTETINLENNDKIEEEG